jgi:hypothetical protein
MALVQRQHENLSAAIGGEEIGDQLDLASLGERETEHDDVWMELAGDVDRLLR